MRVLGFVVDLWYQQLDVGRKRPSSDPRLRLSIKRLTDAAVSPVGSDWADARPLCNVSEALEALL